MMPRRYRAVKPAARSARDARGLGEEGLREARLGAVVAQRLLRSARRCPRLPCGRAAPAPAGRRARPPGSGSLSRLFTSSPAAMVGEMRQAEHQALAPVADLERARPRAEARPARNRRARAPSRSTRAWAPRSICRISAGRQRVQLEPARARARWRAARAGSARPGPASSPRPPRRRSRAASTHRARDLFGRELLEHRNDRRDRRGMAAPAELADRVQAPARVAEVAAQLGAARAAARARGAPLSLARCARPTGAARAGSPCRARRPARTAAPSSRASPARRGRSACARCAGGRPRAARARAARGSRRACAAPPSPRSRCGSAMPKPIAARSTRRHEASITCLGMLWHAQRLLELLRLQSTARAAAPRRARSRSSPAAGAADRTAGFSSRTGGGSWSARAEAAGAVIGADRARAREPLEDRARVGLARGEDRARRAQLAAREQRELARNTRSSRSSTARASCAQPSSAARATSPLAPASANTSTG